MDMQQFYAQEIEPLRQASLTRPHPNFFIVGAAKSGTTSLWAYLKQHPEIAMPTDESQKEPAFFSLYWPWRPHVEQYLKLFADAIGKKAIGEASTSYLVFPESAELIHQTYPHAKIIIILRNPAERAFSLYQWMLREGYENLFPFEKALAAEEDRMKDECFKFHQPIYYYYRLYYHSGLYSEQILRYMQHFPKEHLKILLFDDLKNHPRRTMHELYEFLRVETHFTPTMTIHNQGRRPFWIAGQFFFRNLMPHLLNRCAVPGRIRGRLRKYALATNIWFGQYRSLTFLPETRQTLLRHYGDDIRTTSQLIARNLDMWLVPSEKQETE